MFFLWSKGFRFRRDMILGIFFRRRGGLGFVEIKLPFNLIFGNARS